MSKDLGSITDFMDGSPFFTGRRLFNSAGSLAAILIAVLFSFGSGAASRGDEHPLTLHPKNTHYLLFRGKPTILVTSGEHYGAVLNLDFDYIKYLDALAKDGLNNTRTFSGVYAEVPGNFNIKDNTLAPAEGRLICPWARSEQPGYAGGGNKFDLSRWDEKYFARLKDFVEEAGKRGIIVELDLFCPMYEETMWKVSPMNSDNNINGIGKIARDRIHTLDGEPALLKTQEEFVRKIVAELKQYDNLYYEVCNEPYFGGGTQEWHDRIADVIIETEKEMPGKHLVSWNVQNGNAKIDNPRKAYSIFNFHYASPPVTVEMNYALEKVIGLNETGFKGTGDSYYRHEAWEFMLSGGAIYNNLDYSFTVKTPDGTGKPEDPTPGGGGVQIRKQIGLMKKFLDDFDILNLVPDRSVVEGDGEYALVEKDRQYAIYLRDSKDKKIKLNLPKGQFSGFWLNPINGDKTDIGKFRHDGGVMELSVPSACTDGVALKLVAG